MFDERFVEPDGSWNLDGIRGSFVSTERNIANAKKHGLAEIPLFYDSGYRLNNGEHQKELNKLQRFYEYLGYPIYHNVKREATYIRLQKKGVSQ